MNRWLVAFVPGFLFPSHDLLAHHSRAEFSGDDVEIEGELTAVIWRNPHPTFRLRLSDGSRDEVEVQVYGSIGTLVETGVNQTLFSVGDQVTIAGRFSSRRPNLLLGTHAMLPSGLEAVLQYSAEPRWSGERVGGLGMEVIDESVLARASVANRGIFRVWSRRSANSAIQAMLAMSPQFTEAGLEARDDWDLTDNPITRGECPWMPHLMFQPAIREFVDHGKYLSLHVPYLGGANRTIWLDEVPASVDQSPSKLGTSVGNFDGNTLTVETTGISAPAFDSQGSLQSADMRIVERFTLSDDQSRLDYEMVMTDPIAFSPPAVFRYEFLALEAEPDREVCSSVL